MSQTAAEQKVAAIVKTMRDEMKVYEIKLDTPREIITEDSLVTILAWRAVQVSPLNKVYVVSACGESMELKPGLIYAEIIADHLIAFLQEAINDLQQH